LRVVKKHKYANTKYKAGKKTKKLSLEGKIAIVTGSSKGIGFAIAKEFAENKGATVIVCSRYFEHARRASAQIKGRALPFRLDVTDKSSINEFMRQIKLNHKRVDILLNNSGYPFDRNIWYKSFHEVTDEELDRIIEVDLKGSIRLARAVIPSMLEAENLAHRDAGKKELCQNEGPQNRGGVIINISSIPAIAGHSYGSPYTIAKSGNIALTKCIAREYGSRNIRAYTLALGNISTKATY
jgi:3-oxoacyl-[acyl-carrier protein] reductase